MVELSYILSASHSGSTLLAMLVGSHPDAVTVGELAPSSLGNIAEYRCSCGALMLGCGFWKRVAVEMSRRETDFELAGFHTDFQLGSSALTQRLLRPLCRGPRLEAVRDLTLAMCPSWRARFPSVRHNVRALAEVLVELTGRRWVVDSSKRALQLKYLLTVPGLRIKVIRLIRDGRAVALTYMDPWRFADARNPKLRGGGAGVARSLRSLSMIEAAHEWRRSNEEAEMILNTLEPFRSIEVRYEELCADPPETLSRLFEFMELPPADALGNFRCQDHHVLGNGMRFDSTAEIRLDERWKSHLSRKQLQQFEAEAGDLNHRYGYA